MHILEILAFALSSNLDNLVAGIAFGSTKTILPFSSNLLIAIISSSGSLVSIIIGRNVTTLAQKNQWIASDVGAIIIIVIGFYLIIQSIRQREVQPISFEKQVESHSRNFFRSSFVRLQRLTRLLSDPLLADYDHSHSIELQKASVLGLALTLNNIPTGFAAGLIGLNPTLTTITIFFFSLFTIWLGLFLGSRLIAKVLRNWAGTLGGVLLVVLGVFELFN